MSWSINPNFWGFQRWMQSRSSIFWVKMFAHGRDIMQFTSNYSASMFFFHFSLAEFLDGSNSTQQRVQIATLCSNSPSICFHLPSDHASPLSEHSVHHLQGVVTPHTTVIAFPTAVKILDRPVWSFDRLTVPWKCSWLLDRALKVPLTTQYHS